MTYLKEYEKWLSGAVDSAIREELETIAGDDEQIKARFNAPLKFGTGGLRGIIGAGISRMNIYTVRQATQGMASLILRQGGRAAERGVVIAHDCRRMSSEFAKEAACVLAANGIRVYLFDDMRPTPELSFAVRELGCIAGINITASHNPKEYNGYKAYWEDGAQLSPELSDVVQKEIAAADIFGGVKTMPFERAQDFGLLRMVGADIDERYLERVLSLSVNREAVERAAERFKLVYTPFHGAGYRLVPEALGRLGFRNILTVPEQMVPDGDFSTVKSPNPEEREGFELAVRLAEANGADLVIATDPDADRLGVVCRDADGHYRALEGNQIGILLLCYLIEAHRQKGTLPSDAAVISTVVSTLMTDAVCEKEGLALFKVLTGFKFIGEKMEELEKSGSHSFFFAFEESYGYLAGDHARDKDAVSAALLISEAAAFYSLRGLRLADVLERLYERYGYYRERTINLVMPGVDGPQRMKRATAALRQKPPERIGGLCVSSVEDYLAGDATHAQTGAKTALSLPKSDVLVFRLSDGSAVAVRPSGTEPKVKCYLLVKGADKDDAGRKLAALDDDVRAMLG